MTRKLGTLPEGDKRSDQGSQWTLRAPADTLGLKAGIGGLITFKQEQRGIKQGAAGFHSDTLRELASAAGLPDPSGLKGGGVGFLGRTSATQRALLGSEVFVTELRKLLPPIDPPSLREDDGTIAARQAFRVLTCSDFRGAGDLVRMAFEVALFALRVAANGEPTPDTGEDGPPAAGAIERLREESRTRRSREWSAVRAMHGEIVPLPTAQEARAMVYDLMTEAHPTRLDDTLAALPRCDPAFSKVTADDLAKVLRRTRRAAPRAAWLSLGCGAFNDQKKPQERTPQKAVERIAMSYRTAHRERSQAR